jgi:Fe-S-cluster containining protein
MTTLFDTYADVMTTLDQTTAELATEYQAQMQCRAGCFGCCIDGFRIRYIEAVEILKGFAQLPPEQAAQVIAQLQGPSTGRCPMLVEGQCSVYANRPALCRAFGLIVQVQDSYGSCSLNFQEVESLSSLKALNLSPYYEVIEELSQRLWEAQPLPNLPATVDGSTEPGKAPRLSIRRYLSSLLSLQAQAEPCPAGSA